MKQIKRLFLEGESPALRLRIGREFENDVWLLDDMLGIKLKAKNDLFKLKLLLTKSLLIKINIVNLII